MELRDVDHQGLDGDRAMVIDGGRPTFEVEYETHYRDVYRFVVLRAGHTDVDEVVAETFGRAFTAWQSGHGPAGRTLPWLLTIARRLMTDDWRRSRLVQWLHLAPHDAPEPRGGYGVSDDGTSTVDFWLWFDAVSQVLPERQREVLLLRYQRDLTDADIGEILGLSASGVRTLASRALGNLRLHPELWR
jgi:RNA polymerase sigma factor (sigma-70 family)